MQPRLVVSEINLDVLIKILLSNFGAEKKQACAIFKFISCQPHTCVYHVPMHTQEGLIRNKKP